MLSLEEFLSRKLPWDAGRQDLYRMTLTDSFYIREK